MDFRRMLIDVNLAYIHQDFLYLRQNMKWGIHHHLELFQGLKYLVKHVPSHRQTFYQYGQVQLEFHLPYRAHYFLGTSYASFRKPSGGMTIPASPWIGSNRKPAVFSLIAAFNASISPYGITLIPGSNGPNPR